MSDFRRERDKRSSFLEKFNTFRQKEKKDKTRTSWRPPDVLEEPGFGDAGQLAISNLTDGEVNEKFEQMLDDMNLTEEKKSPLRNKKPDEKRKMLALQWKGITVQHKGVIDNPSDFIRELNHPELRGEKRLRLLESLRVSLTSNPVSWVIDFGVNGLNAVLKNLTYCYDNKSERRSVYECVRCLKAYMNNKFGLMEIIKHEEALTILARSIDRVDPSTMLEALRLLAAICLVPPEGHEKALEGITVCSEIRNQERFTPIIDGLVSSGTNTAMRVACIQLINAIVSTPDDLDFRMHLRNEIMRTGLVDILESLEKDGNEDVKIHVTIFNEHKEEDFEEFSHRYDNIHMELDDLQWCFGLICQTVSNTSAEPFFLSILQHLLFIRDDIVIRPQYYKLIEECVSQVVLHRSGVDPDFRHTKRFDIDVDPLIANLIEKSKVEDNLGNTAELAASLEAALTAKQESEAKVSSLEEKLKLQEQEINTLKEKISLGIGTVVSEALNKQAGGGGMPVGGAVPPAPPLPPGPGGMPPPPPPPPPGIGGGPPVPPPPPFPGGGIPPPPPPPGSGPPPPPPFGGIRPPNVGILSPPVAKLPHGMTPKQKYKLDTQLKRANWNKIKPNQLDKSSFWVRLNESSLADDDIFQGLSYNFAAKPPPKALLSEDTEDKKKKGKQLRVLDGKTAQNLSILLGSLKLPYDVLKERILKCDEENLSLSMIEQLVKCLPEPEQMKKLSKLKDEFDDLADPEQFCATISGIKRLVPRLNSLAFKMRFPELMQEVKPDVVGVTAACDEVKQSGKFARLLELILLMGNYMNAGSRNEQSVGFEINYLTKLENTKDRENKQTLIHFLADTVENKFPDLLNFHEELMHVDRASRVSEDNLTKNISGIKKSLHQLEIDIKNFASVEGDSFAAIMKDFVNVAKEQYDVLHSMHKKMLALFKDLAKFYCFEPGKYGPQELFGDIKIFIKSFQKALKENAKIRETREKIMRAKGAREKAEREKKEKIARKKAIVDMSADDDQEGVMDNLLEALKTGTAFNMQREGRAARKRTPRAAGAERRAQLARSRSRTNLTVNSPDVMHEINFEENNEIESESVTSPRRPERRRNRNKPISGHEHNSRDRTGNEVINNGDANSDADDLLARLKAL